MRNEQSGTGIRPAALRMVQLADMPIRRLSGDDHTLLVILRSLAVLLGLLGVLVLSFYLWQLLAAGVVWTAKLLTHPVMLAVYTGVGLLALAVMAFQLSKWFYRQRSIAEPEAIEELKPTTKAPVASGTRKFSGYKWGDPAPTTKQFGYALSLGVEPRNGMTKYDFSNEIDDVIEQLRAHEPATKDQLETIKEYHGVLPRPVTRGEANEIIEFLEDHDLPCPFCGTDIAAVDDECWDCGKSLKRMKIPVELNFGGAKK